MTHVTVWSDPLILALGDRLKLLNQSLNDILEIIQFNIQFEIKSKIFIQTFILSLWKKRFKMISGPEHVLSAQMRALFVPFSTLHV